MPNSIKPKAKYVKPKLIESKGIDIGDNSYVDKHEINGKHFFVKKDIKVEHLQILKILLKAGLPVEEPFLFETKNFNKSMVFFGLGENIKWIYSNFSTKKKEDILNQIVNVIGKMHSLNITHNHPHIGNFVIDEKGKVSLVDFKSAELNKINWENSNQICDVFFNDYLWINGVLGNLGANKIQAFKLFSLLVSKYNCSLSVKKQILNQIKNDIITPGKAHFLLHF